jgi:hypothetical protein
MTENSNIAKHSEATSDLKSSKDELQQTPLLPRSAWKSQLTYLKVLLKAKQTLDTAQININSTNIR